MRIALIADIHANLHALKAVLNDIGEAGMDQLVCLGDVVGYGAQDGNPVHGQLDEHRFLLPCNCFIAVTAGATGQPRDGDHRARWLSWDTGSRVLEFHRVKDDHDAAAEAILAARLPKRSAERLLPWFHPPL